MRFKKTKQLTPYEQIDFAVKSAGMLLGRYKTLKILERWVDLLSDPTSNESLTIDVFGGEKENKK